MGGCSDSNGLKCNLKRDLLRIDLSVDPPPLVFPAAVRASVRQRTHSGSQATPFGNMVLHSKAREAQRLWMPTVEPPRALFGCELAQDKLKWEKYLN
jgi:hypothetical protein